MGKGKKKKRTFNYEKDRRREWRNKKKTPTINCETIKNNWDSKKSLKANLAQMGLAFDPNQATTTKDKTRKAVPVSKTNVVEELEQIASTVVPVKLTMAQPDMQFCKYMSEKYGEDYVAMSRDLKNYYQETPKQIRRKINKYFEILRESKS
jgi:hypothetical protein